MSQQNIQEKDKVFFLSFERYYTIAIHIAIIFSLYVASTYGIVAAEILREGTWFVLGGFSIWYPTSLLILPLIILMLLYVIFTRRWISIEKKEDKINIRESYLYFRKSETEISKKELTYMKFSEGKLGARYAWIIMFSIHMIYILTDGIYLITNTNAFGLYLPQAITYIASGIIDFIIILLIAIPGVNVLEFHTANDVYTMKFASWKKDKNLLLNLKQILEINESQINDGIEEEKLNYPKYQENLSFSKELIIGALFIVIGVISRIYNVFAGTPLRLSLYLLGIVLIIYGLKNAPNGKRYTQNNKVLAIKQDRTAFFHSESPLKKSSAILINDKETFQEIIKEKMSLKKDSPFEIILTAITALFLGWTLSAWFRFSNNSEYLTGFNILMIFMSLIVLIMLLIMFINPQMVIEYDSKYEKGQWQYNQALFNINNQDERDTDQATVENNKQAVKKKELNENKSSFISKWIKKLEYAFNHEKGQFMARLGIIISLFLIGILIGLF